MKISLHHQNQKYEADLSKPLDISIPLLEGDQSVNCFYAPLMETFPVDCRRLYVGSTTKGGPLNFLNVRLNPHGNGTHTECVGHIAKEPFSINKSLKKFSLYCKISQHLSNAKDVNNDRVIMREQD